MTQYPFVNYKVIDIPQTNSESGVVVYQTTALSFMHFVPDGTRMEDDSRISLYVDNYFVDADGGPADFYLYSSRATTSSPVNLNLGENTFDNLPQTNVPGIIPAGKNVVARVGDNSDRIGGTLYVFELPA